MKRVSEADLRTGFVDPMLKGAGWEIDDIIREPVFYGDGRIYRPDYILSIDSIPAAVLEVKSNVKSLEDAKEQIENYCLTIGIQFGFAVIGNKVYQVNTNKDSLEEIDRLPNKELIKKSLNIEVPESELPIIRNLHQMQAISSVFKAIGEGNKRISVGMSTGSGKHITQIKIISKILASGSHDQILVLFDRSELKNQFSKSCEKIGIGTEEWDVKKTTNSNGGLFLASINDVNMLDDWVEPKYVFFDEMHQASIDYDVFEKFSSSTLIYFSSVPNKFIDNYFGKPIYTYTLSNVIQEEVLTPPDGFETVKLGEISEISVGRYLKKDEENAQTSINAKALKIADLSHPFSFNDVLTIDVPDNVKGLIKVTSGDILLSRMFHSQPRLVIVEECDGELVLLPQSILLIRVTDPTISPSDVYNFLNSDIGKRALTLYTNTGSTIQKSFSVKQLREIGIFIPIDETGDDIGLQLSTVVVK